MAKNRLKAGRWLAVTAALGLGLAACGSSGGGGSSASGPPKTGGTLKLVGAGDVDHLDTASGYYSPTYLLERAISRQLVSYPNDKDINVSKVPVADMAQAINKPTDNGLTYTFKIRPGVLWDAPGGPRQVTAQDVVRGFK